jgi:hypothetical protein
MAAERHSPLVVVTFAAFALLAFLAPAARVPQASASYVPVGVSTNGSTSVAWFQEETSGQTFACQTSAQPSGLSPIQCVAAKLP